MQLNNNLFGPPARLLVSVRSAGEAEAALCGGAQLIDVKEPASGALGAASLPTIAAVVRKVAGRALVSAALGELPELDQRHVELPTSVALAKIGLAGCARLTDWQERLGRAYAALPPEVARVGVVYADWKHAESPEPEQVLLTVVNLSVSAILIDTFDKSGGTTLSAWERPRLREFISAVRGQRLPVVLAGSLSERDIDEAVSLSPDWIAVRRAACAAGRTSAISWERVARLAEKIDCSNPTRLPTQELQNL